MFMLSYFTLMAKKRTSQITKPDKNAHFRRKFQTMQKLLHLNSSNIYIKMINNYIYIYIYMKNLFAKTDNSKNLENSIYYVIMFYCVS